MALKFKIITTAHAMGTITSTAAALALSYLESFPAAAAHHAISYGMTHSIKGK